MKENVIDLLLSFSDISSDPGEIEAMINVVSAVEIINHLAKTYNGIHIEGAPLDIYKSISIAKELYKHTWEILILIGKRKAFEHEMPASTITLSPQGFKFSAKVKTISDMLWLCYANLVSLDIMDFSRIQQCKKCGKVFYQHNRTNQKFCSKSCSDMGRRGTMYTGLVHLK